MDAIQEVPQVFWLLAGMVAHYFPMGITVDRGQSVYLSDFVIISHNLLPEIRHSLHCSGHTHDMIEVLGQLRIWKLSDDEGDVGVFIVVGLADLASFELIAWGEGCTVAEVELAIDGIVVDVLDLIVSDLIGMDVVVVAGVDHWFHLVLQ